jgi:ribose transport system substrate-binding protein
MKMKKSLLMKLTLGLMLALLVLSACATPDAETPAAPEEPAVEEPAEMEKLFVGYSGPTQLDNFQIVLWEGMQERAAELGIEVVMLESDWDVVKQAADIEDLLTQGVDALIVNAADADGTVPSIEQANAQGVPVFSIDSAANGGEVLSHSGNDLYCIGYRSMEYLGAEMGGSGKILHVNGVPGLMIVTWNDNGIDDFIADNPDFELVMHAYGEWDQAKAQAITEDVLTANPDLGGVYIMSESMTGGVVQALAAAGLTDTVKVMNGGWGPESQEWLANGEIVGTMEWASKEGAAELMQYVYDYVTEGSVPPTWSPWPVKLHTPDGETVQVDCPIEGWAP